MYLKTPGSSVHGSQALTHVFRVSVVPRFLHEEPLTREYTFAYRVRIANESDVSATLLTRYWLIIDAFGRRKEVRGEGVIGVQPRLSPGDAHEYESFCPLSTTWGTMEGSYTFQTDDDRTLEIAIARFYLVCPRPERSPP